MDDLDDVEVARLTTMASGALVTQMIAAAASLGIADALGADTATATELAERCGADDGYLQHGRQASRDAGILGESGNSVSRPR